MKKHTKIISLLLAVVLIMTVMSMTVWASSGNGFIYEFADDEIIITGYNGTENSVEIPAEIDGYPVTTIANFAFVECTSVTEIIISAAISSIGLNALHCENIENIFVDEDNQNYSNDEHGVLFNKNKTLLISYPSGNTATVYSIPDSVETIGYAAFYGAVNLSIVEIPDSVTKFELGAFSHSAISSVTIPGSITKIGEAAFNTCPLLTSITISKNVTIIGNSAFYGCTSLEEVNYCGTKEEWDNLKNNSEIYNDELFDAPVNYEVHINNDGNKNCDICDTLLFNCTCNCHSTSGFISFFWKILNFFQRIFGINKYCECGISHY